MGGTNTPTCTLTYGNSATGTPTLITVTGGWSSTFNPGTLYTLEID